MHDGIRIEPGVREDCTQLSAFHYRAGLPRAVTRIVRATHPDAGVVGVAMEARCILNSRARDAATRGRYRIDDRRERANILNREMRTIARVIVSPQWRGLGVGVALVRSIVETRRTRFVEAFAAMGRVHPLFERAGMTRFDVPLREADVSLRDMLESVDADTIEGIQSDSQRREVCDALNSWRRRSRGRWGGRDANILLREARRAILCPPLYYLAGMDARS